MQHISGENVRNTEREAENNAQHTGPIISQLERSFGTKMQRIKMLKEAIAEALGA